MRDIISLCQAKDKTHMQVLFTAHQLEQPGLNIAIHHAMCQNKTLRFISIKMDFEIVQFAFSILVP